MTDQEKVKLKEFCELNSFTCIEDKDGWIYISMPIPVINNKLVTGISIIFSELQVEEKSLRQITGWMKERYCNAIWNSLDVPHEED